MILDYIRILYAVLALGLTGLACGLILAFASKLFRVEVDSHLEPIIKALPGVNCGGCGYPNCAACAEAILKGEASADCCPVGGEEAGEAISKILGIELKKNTRLTAVVRCSGGTRTRKKYDYYGITDCLAASGLSGGPNECPYGCVGLGSCVKACVFGAISMRDGVAVVDHERCTGCLQCISACPKKIIQPAPYFADINIACSSHDRGSMLRMVCEIGCVGCRICEKACKNGAITINENLAEIDYEKCTGCGDCVERCPRKLIIDSKLDKRPVSASL